MEPTERSEQLSPAAGGMSPSPVAAPPARSAAPRVFGVLSIIFASLTLCFTLMSGCIQVFSKGDKRFAAMMSMGSKDPTARAAAVERFSRATHVATVTQTVGFSLLSIALLIVGIGQVRYSRWAWRGTIVWSCTALPFLLATIAIGQLLVRPAMREYMEAMQRTAQNALEASLNSALGSITTSSWMTMGSVLLYAPYPLLLLITFLRPRTREALSG